MQAEVKNRNGRMYPKEMLQKEVARYIKEYVENLKKYSPKMVELLNNLEKINNQSGLEI